MNNTTERSIVVSVIVLAYNHEDTIADALEGIVKQRLHYSIEVLVHDDASTDRTAEIIKKYEKQYFFVKGIYQTENQYKMGYKPLILGILSKCKGKYIAVCEGDDFWIDDNKLQVQIDFMENYAEYVMTAHNAISYHCKTHKILGMAPYSGDREVNPKEIIIQSCGNLPTASLVFRKDIMDMEDFFYQSGVIDWPWQLNAITKGKVFYFDRIMSVYRAFGEGAWTSSVKSNKKRFILHCVRMIEFLRKYNSYTGGQFGAYIVGKITGYINEIQWTERGLEILKNYESLEIQMSTKNVEQIIKNAENLYGLIYDENYLPLSIERYLQQHEKTYIYGAGNFASILVNKMERNALDYDGFVETRKTKEYYKGKKVWQFSDVISTQKSFGVIVAVSPEKWYQIYENLKKNMISDYIVPFLWNEEERG